MSISASVRERLLNSFRAELAEHVQTMTDGLLGLEQQSVSGNQKVTLLEDIFRAAHSLKGASRAMGVTMIEQLAHSLESVLAGLQVESVELTSELCSSCYQVLDAIQMVQAAYEAGETTPPAQALQALAGLERFRPTKGAQGAPARRRPSNPPPEPEADPSGQTPPAVEESLSESLSLGVGRNGTIRVSVEKLDSLMAQLSELLVTKIRAEQRLEQVRQFQGLTGEWYKEWLATRSAYERLVNQDAYGLIARRRLGPVEASWNGDHALLASPGNGKGLLDDPKFQKDLFCLIDFVSTAQQRLREVNGLAGDLVREYANDTTQMSLVVDGLEEEVKRVRMLPLNTITGPFRRMVRDLAQAAGKEATLHLVGGETELDKRVLERIKDPLIHLLRNAVDHGIERPEERQQAGKERQGGITLAAEQSGKDVVIQVSDDGTGLDMASIRSTVARRAGGDAQGLTEGELVEAIFRSGVSTTPIITDISGRGIGLDVVRRNVEMLHGRIDVDSRPGQGVTFALTLPLALTSSRALLVRVAGQLYAIPLNAVQYILSICPDEVLSLEGRETLRYEGRPVTLVWLGDVLELAQMDRQRNEGQIPVVILAAAERRLAFAVDELMGEQEVVIKGLGGQLKRVEGIAGATVMGDGKVVLILNASDLIRLASQGSRRSLFDTLAQATSDGNGTHQNILVVDDSITTRTLEKNILEAAGYRVGLAINGKEALQVISKEMPDLVVSDVVMPHMDGFDLTERLKNNSETAHLPVILVTSLDSAADKARGIEVGADAYITKNTFDQSNLLETIEQLI